MKFTLKIPTKILQNQKFDLFLRNLSEALIKMTTILFLMIVQLVELFIAVVAIIGSHA